MSRKPPKTAVVAFKVEEQLAEFLNKLPNKSAFIRKAIAARPDYPMAHQGLGRVLQEAGKNREAQEAFDKASTHLKTYRGRVTALSGQEQLELDSANEATLPLIDKASA